MPANDPLIPSGASISLFDANTFLTTPQWPVMSGSHVTVYFNIYVWGATVGDGTADDLLVGSSAGLGGIQPVALVFPHAPGVAFDITLQTSDAADVDVWNSTSSTPTGTPDLGGGVSSMVIHAGPNDTSWPLEIGAVDDAATEAGLTSVVLSFTAEISATRSTSEPPPGTEPAPSQPVDANAVDPHSVKLDVQTILIGNSDGSLPDAQKQSVGAFVPVDNNDWDYNKLSDLDQPGAVTGGDKYLLPVILHALPGAAPGDFYQLTATAGIRVFLHSDRSGLLFTQPLPFGTVAFSLSQIPADRATIIYVEGVTEGTVASGPSVLSLNLYWKGVTYMGVDSCKVNVFTLATPLDVPGKGTYTYTADDTSGRWVAQLGGKIVAGADATTPNSMSIVWTNSPEVGHVYYQAGPNYVWRCDVNVVGLQVVTSALTYTSSGQYQMPLPPGFPAGFFPQILSSNNLTGLGGLAYVASSKPAMDARATVAVRGAFVDGQQRGNYYIDFGGIQNAYVYGVMEYSGGLTRTNDLSGIKFLDWTDVGARDVAPWVNSTGWMNKAPTYNVTSGLPSYVPPQTGANPQYNFPIEFWDTPGVNVTDIFGVGAAGWLYKTKMPLIAYAAKRFTLFVAAHTTYGGGMGVNGSNSIYVGEAEADWAFNASGSIAGNVWKPSIGAGTSGDARFRPVTSDLLTTGPAAVKSVETWSEGQISAG